MSMMGDLVRLGEVASSCLAGGTDSSCSRSVLLLFLISLSSFLIVSPCELQSVDDLGRIPPVVEVVAGGSCRLSGTVARGDWHRPSAMSKRKACFVGVLSWAYKKMCLRKRSFKDSGSFFTSAPLDLLLADRGGGEEADPPTSSVVFLLRS